MIERIALYDPQAIRVGLADFGLDAVAAVPDDCASDPQAGPLSTEEAQWRRALLRIADDPRGPLRPVLMGTSEMAAEVADLSLHSPHFYDVTRLFRRAALASARTCTRMRVPPILVVGPPGLGKTHYARRLALALGDIHLVAISINLLGERGRINGSSLSWRGARMGALAQGLLAAANRISGPVFLLEELDKPPRGELVHESLLSLLEPENSCSYVDEYLTSLVTLRLDHAMVIATANDLSAIPGPLLDRMQVVEIEAPGGDALRTVVASIHSDVASSYGPRFSSALAPRVMARLATMTPRRIKRLIDLAIPIAIERGRWHLTVEDLEEAAAMAPAARTAMGFLASPARPNLSDREAFRKADAGMRRDPSARAPR